MRKFGTMPNRFAKSRARLAIIDGDSILYAVALSAEMKAGNEEGEDLWFQLKDEEECYREVVARLDEQVTAVGAEDAIVALTTSPCFRYAILPTYKANRKATRRPPMLLPLQAMVQERKPFGTLAVRGLEADDVCGVSSGALQKAGLREPVIVSIDKDLRSIPGLVFSPRHPELGVEEITEEAADRAHLYQTLIGDPVDGYTGCPGVGPKKANRILDECSHSSRALQWAFIEGAFMKRGQTPSYALTQARVARILRSSEWDAYRRDITLWSPEGASQDVVPLDSLAVH
jgi:DNA polymerase-1